MRFVCDAAVGKAWFWIETEAEAARESELMRHAVEKHFRRAYEEASQCYRPVPGPFVEQDIGREAHIRRTMPVFNTPEKKATKATAIRCWGGAWAMWSARPTGAATSTPSSGGRSRRSMPPWRS